MSKRDYWDCCVLPEKTWAWSSGPPGDYMVLYRCAPLIIFLLTRLFYNSLSGLSETESDANDSRPKRCK